VITRINLAQELGEIILVVLRVGALLACSGAAAFRVREAMQRTAVALGATRSEFVMTVDALTASVFDGSEFRTQVVRLPPVGVDMNLLCRIELLTRSLGTIPELTPRAVHARLDALQSAERLYPRWLSVPSLGAACAAFCAAGQGDALQIAGAFVGAAVGHSLRLVLLARRVPLVSIVVICAFVSSAASAAVLRAFAAFGGGDGAPGIASVASVLYLIPGVPLVTSLVDLIHLDLSTGLSRSAYSAVLVACIAVGVFGFIAVTRLLGG
jgi:uncharacterized membrane protein YjjP (DUF1212 family)